MAVAPHGTPTHLGYGSHTNPSLSEPSGVSAGDVLLLTGLTFSGSGAAPVPSPPAGWTAVPGSTSGQVNNIAFGGGFMALWAWTKTSTGSGTHTITVSGSCDFWMGAYSGVDTTNPAPVNWRRASGTGVTSSAAGVNTYANGVEVVVIGGDNGSSSSTLSISGSTPTFTSHIISQGVFSVFDGNIATQGSMAIKTFTNNNSSTEGWLTATLILNPPGAAALNYDDTVLSDRPVSYYPMNELSGTTCIDAALNLNGLYQGTPINLGVVGIGDGEPAVYFDGATDRIDFTGTPLWNQLQQNYSLEIFLKLADLTGSNNGTFITNGNPGPGNFLGFGMSLQGLHLYMAFPGHTDYDSGYVFADTRWHHCVLVNNAGTSHVYVDGVLQPNSTTQLPDQNSNESLIGYGYGSYFKGTMAKAAYYDKVLNSTQIAAHLNSVPAFVELDAVMTMYANATLDGYNIGHATLNASMAMSAAASMIGLGTSTPEAPVSSYFAR